jgi:hypothetical protein
MIAPSLIKSVKGRGGLWFEDKVNLVGIRSTSQLPDRFNDELHIVFKRPALPNKIDTMTLQQTLCNALSIYRMGLITVDGIYGNETKDALNWYNSDLHNNQHLVFDITTVPGVVMLNKPINPKGALVMKPGQYVDAYQSGYHKGNKLHPALIQCGKITVYRDNDKDDIAEETNLVENGLFGANIHGAKQDQTRDRIGAYSAGCQVHNTWDNLLTMMSVVYLFEGLKKQNKFTYTLLRESELILS